VGLEDVVTTVLAEMLQYVDANYGVDAALRINDEIEKFTDLVSKMPRMFPKFKQRDSLRKAVIDKRVVVIYFINENWIEVIRVLDSKSDYQNFFVK
jgi:plasmid stabilization system protein ParE